MLEYWGCKGSGWRVENKTPTRSMAVSEVKKGVKCRTQPKKAQNQGLEGAFSSFLAASAAFLAISSCWR